MFYVNLCYRYVITSYRLSGRQIDSFSACLESLKSDIPDEFARKPQPLKHIDRWKATEFRQFLLYIALVILKDIQKPEYYTHFNTLHTAVSILSSAKLCISYNTYAQDLLLSFVKICYRIVWYTLGIIQCSRINTFTY